MPNLSLRNVPEEVCNELKETAARNRRSVNQEAILRLIGGKKPRMTAEERVMHLRKFRATFPPGFVMDDDTTQRYIREGRE